MPVSKPRKMKKNSNKSSDKIINFPGPRCGLCGNTKNLTKTKCCDNWICDDASQYKLFSYARNSCYRNHDRYTVCAFHFHESHLGRWLDCQKCMNDFSETELYVEAATNEYNFEKLKNPPKFKPTKCSKCSEIIVLADGGYIMSSKGYFCFKCHDLGPIPDFT